MIGDAEKRDDVDGDVGEHERPASSPREVSSG
jgi:hypothetical protein